MTPTETLRKHETQCQECERVRRGLSPFCSAQKVLALFAEDDETETPKAEN